MIGNEYLIYAIPIRKTFNPNWQFGGSHQQRPCARQSIEPIGPKLFPICFGCWTNCHRVCPIWWGGKEVGKIERKSNNLNINLQQFWQSKFATKSFYSASIRISNGWTKFAAIKKGQWPPKLWCLLAPSSLLSGSPFWQHWTGKWWWWPKGRTTKKLVANPSTLMIISPHIEGNLQSPSPPNGGSESGEDSVPSEPRPSSASPAKKEANETATSTTASPVEMVRGLSPERDSVTGRKISFSTAPIRVYKTHVRIELILAFLMNMKNWRKRK